MSQNQSYFWQTTRHNVYLKRSAKLQMFLALMAVLTFATICAAEVEPKMDDDNGIIQGAPTNVAADVKLNEAENQANILTENQADKDGTTETKSNNGFIDAFTASISVILLTELGDKTFFIAAIMAMRHPRLIVFTGAISALALMTVLSVVFGMAATIIPYVYTYYISTALFAIFGIKMLYEGYNMRETDAQEEMEEVQSDLRKREDELLRKSGRKFDDAIDAKRKNSNSDKEDNGAGAEQALIHHKNSIKIVSGGGVGVTGKGGVANNNNNNNNNIEMQHRQRKQQRSTNNLKNHNSCDRNDFNGDIDAARDYNESEVFLDKHGNAQLKMSSYHSSPALSQQTHATDCDINSPLKSNNCNKATEQEAADMSNPTLVHSQSAQLSVGRTNKNGIIGAPIAGDSINGSLNSIIDAGSVTGVDIVDTAAGQPSNGELKQRLDRDVNAALVKDPESGVVRMNKRKTATYLSTRIFVQAFTMTFLAEWGDRSQITTIILAASKDVFGVIAGGVLGHSICTGLAVIGGRIVAAKISVRTVTIVGGIVFIGFAVYSLLMPPEKF